MIETVFLRPRRYCLRKRSHHRFCHEYLSIRPVRDDLRDSIIINCDGSFGRLESNETFKEPPAQIGNPLLQVGPPE